MYPVATGAAARRTWTSAGAGCEAIERALQDQLGVIPVEIKPFGLAGSGGSTPMRVKVKGEPETYLFAKLYATTHVRSDRWYKLGRTLMYGRLEDEKAFNTVRRLVQYEDYMLRLMRDAGLPVPQPYGIVEITPEREYLLVTEMLDGAKEIGEAEVDDAIIDQGLAIVRRLWEAGLAHRDIKPANLLVRDGTVHAHRLGVRRGAAEPVAAGGRPGQHDAGAGAAHRRQAGLRAGACGSSPIDEIAEAFAATRGLTMPSQLRTMMRQQGRDLHAEFCALLPDRPQPVRIQRWSLRRVLLTAWVLVMASSPRSSSSRLLKSPL